MFWVRYLIFVAVIKTCSCKAEDINEITDKRQPPFKIDDNLRKALLKALTDLETEEKAKLLQRSQEISKQTRQTSVDSVGRNLLSDGVFQKAPASTFSFITQSTSSTRLTSTERPTTVSITSTTAQPLTQRPIVIIQKSNGIQHRPITSFLPTAKPDFDLNDSEQFLASASSSFTAAPKFQPFKSASPRSTSERINPNLVSITEKPRSRSTTEVTTPTPVITSSTEESEAKVEDVQFFAAPLVAAFTVHHDEQGLPKSVEPIYKVPGQNSVSTRDLEQRRQKDQDAQRAKLQEERYKEEQNKLQQYLRQQEQRRLEFDLQEKQRLLEQQIRSLQQQQQHQDYILRQQQLFQEQNLLQQRQRLLEEQKSILKKQQSTVGPIIDANQGRFNGQIRNSPLPSQIRNKPVNTNSVSFEPSITFQPAPQQENTLLPFRTQQLPIKSAQDFRLPSSQFTQPSPINTADFRQPTTFQQLPFKNPENFLQPQFSTFAEPPFRKFNPPQAQTTTSVRDFQNFNIKQNFPQTGQGNRVFRQEAGTGNFLNPEFDNRNSLFNLSPPHIQQSTRFFRSNPESFNIVPSVTQDFHNAPNVRPRHTNEQLNNLLFFSGIAGGNRQEDLNIVSKVLSLNHLGSDNFFGGSQILEQRLTPPQ